VALIKFKYKGKIVYSPKYDRVFKEVFIEADRTLLASFLSSVLGWRIEADGITVLNPEKHRVGKGLFLSCPKQPATQC